MERSIWRTLLLIALMSGFLALTACSLQPGEPERPAAAYRGLTAAFPSGRMVGTVYHGEPLNWQDPAVRAEILELDFLQIGDRLQGSNRYAGMVAALHAEKPSLKVIQYTSFPWIWDLRETRDPPGTVPVTAWGRRLYDAFYPHDIAHIVPANPDPAVADTAFHTDGYYMIDLDNPGVMETIADIFHDYVMSGGNPDIDGVLLDWFEAEWGGWCLYGNSPGERGYGPEYWLDYDRDGIPVCDDLDEQGKVRDAFARLIHALHDRFGPDFLVTANGKDAHIGGPMSDGSDFAMTPDGAVTELFPWRWTRNDYWLAAFGIDGHVRNDGQDAWQIAAKGANNPFIPTPQGNYWFMDTFNEQNNPWICVAALLFDNCVAMVSGNPDDLRNEWVGGDPMPLLDQLGQPLAAPVVRGERITRAFEGGTVILEFSNRPANLHVEPWTGGQIHAPQGPFKYRVVRSDGELLYSGGGW
ncbi:MAG: hypothetical protein R6X25_12280 [Candidatus Krumholzibacteriia bacterium]